MKFSQYLDNLHFQANQIEKKLDRGQGTPEEMQRLKEINQRLANIAKVKK